MQAGSRPLGVVSSHLESVIRCHPPLRADKYFYYRCGIDASTTSWNLFWGSLPPPTSSFSRPHFFLQPHCSCPVPAGFNGLCRAAAGQYCALGKPHTSTSTAQQCGLRGSDTGSRSRPPGGFEPWFSVVRGWETCPLLVLKAKRCLWYEGPSRCPSH